MALSEKEVITKNYAYLSMKMDPDSLGPALLAQGLLTDSEYDKVRAQPVKSKASELILAGLVRREEGYLERFIVVLEEDPTNRHIAERLRAGS